MKLLFMQTSISSDTFYGVVFTIHKDYFGMVCVCVGSSKICLWNVPIFLGQVLEMIPALVKSAIF